MNLALEVNISKTDYTLYKWREVVTDLVQASEMVKILTKMATES
jgi:hypothetical protein